MTNIKILSDIEEYKVFQHTNGYATISLYGECYLSDENDYPVIRVVDITREKVVLYKRIPLEDINWQIDIKLEIGMYRIETGIALTQANYDNKYLQKGHIIRNVFVGEIFVIAGQSNAVGYGKDEVIDMPQYGISAYNNGWSIASHPIGCMINNEPNEDNLNSGHSAWLFLGKIMLNENNTPVGLVPVALNGSEISMWAKDKALYKNMIEKAKLTNANNLIWYQGCSNVNGDKHKRYYEELTQLIDNIYNDLGDINIMLVQISGTTNKLSSGYGWQRIREIQRQIAIKYSLPLITTYDLINYSDDIHIGSLDNIKLATKVYVATINKNSEKEIGVILDANYIKLTFNNMQKIRECNIKALDINREKVSICTKINGNEVIIMSDNLNDIRYITLPFDKLYNGLTIKDVNNNCASYFYIDLESDVNASR